MDQSNQEVQFEIFIDQNQEGFAGKCYDLLDERVKSEIKGFVDADGLISFVKEYNEPLVGDDDGSLYMDREAYHPGVHYYGRFNDERLLFEGTWEVQTNESSIGHDEYGVWFDHGSWWMERVYEN